MFRFSCFNTHSLSHKQKKTVHLSTEAMKKTIEDSLQNETRKNVTYLPVANTLNLNVEVETLKSCADCPMDTFAVEGYSNFDEDKSVHDHSVKTTNMKKSQSLGTGLDLKGRDSGGSASEDAIDQQPSFDGSHDNCGSLVPDGGKDSRTSPPDQFLEAHQSDSLYVHGGVGNDEFAFSVGEAPCSDKESHENITDAGFSGGANSGNHTPRTLIFKKSCSLPNIDSPGHVMVSSLRCIKSAEDLSTLDSRRKDTFTDKFETLVFQHREKNDTLISIDNKNHSDNPVDGICINYNYVGSSKDWIIPLDELNINDNHGGNSSFYTGDELPSKDFKVKRIEEWVTDLQHCSPLDESDELYPLDDHTVPTGVIVLDVSPATKMEGKSSPGMEAAKKYISSLGPSATAKLWEDEYQKLANSTIHDLLDKLEEYGDYLDIDGYDIDYGNEVLTVKLGHLGTYVINKQTPNRQIWMSSPVSGPSRFDWDHTAQGWIYRRTKENLLDILESELEQLCGQPVKFS